MKLEMKPNRRGYVIRELKHKEVLTKWGTHFKKPILEAFRDAKFSPGMSMDATGVEEDCYEQVYNRKGQKHIAVLKDGEVVGALFCVDPKKDPKKEKADFSWFFTSPNVLKKDRQDIAHSLVLTAHRLTKKAGYNEIETMVGTEKGEKFLKKEYGYKKHPKNPFMWVKKL